MSVRVEGHFGEWIQGRLGPDGPLALVTVRCPAFWVEARRADRLGGGTWCGSHADWLARAATHLGLDPDTRVALTGTISPGTGGGASTATLVALARLSGLQITPERVAALCLAFEGATDPLMMPVPDAHLWAPRAARSLRVMPPPPSAILVGGHFGAATPTDPRDLAFPDISDLAAAWTRSADARDLPALARLASRSAERCTAMRGPPEDPMPALSRTLGALGHLRAHTGNLRALIFAPGTVPAGACDHLKAAGLDLVLAASPAPPVPALCWPSW